MPIYEYQCEECGENFELRRNIYESDSEIKCPKCQAEYPKRALSAFLTTSQGEDCSPSNFG